MNLSRPHLRWFLLALLSLWTVAMSVPVPLASTAYERSNALFGAGTPLTAPAQGPEQGADQLVSLQDHVGLSSALGRPAVALPPQLPFRPPSRDRDLRSGHPAQAIGQCQTEGVPRIRTWFPGRRCRP